VLSARFRHNDSVAQLCATLERENKMSTKELMSREEIIEKYVDNLVDGMDTKTLQQFVTEILWEQLDKLGDADLLNEVAKYMPNVVIE